LFHRSAITRRAALVVLPVAQRCFPIARTSRDRGAGRWVRPKTHSASRRVAEIPLLTAALSRYKFFSPSTTTETEFRQISCGLLMAENLPLSRREVVESGFAACGPSLTPRSRSTE
jgi:hypothetical protein